MKPKKYDIVSLLAVVIFASAWAALAVADQAAGVTAFAPQDPFLTWMQAAGFPAWAGVLVWGVMRIVNEMHNISTRLESHMLQTERRFENIETIITVRGLGAPRKRPVSSRDRDTDADAA